MILVGLLAFGVEAFGANTNTTTTPDISAIANQVQHKLAVLPWYGIFDNLEYQVNGTEVILSGQVVSEHATTKKDAEKFVD